MKTAVSCCPTRGTWAGFHAGTVSCEELDRLAEHLDRCSACQSLLASVAGPGDELVAGLRAGPTPDPFEAEPECRAAVARLRGVLDGDRPPAGALPERVGEYQVLQLIGRGGMGAVYRAVHTRLGRPVALKVVPADRAGCATALARFRREVAALGRLDHPNVVRATDAGEAEGVTFLVMDLVDGADLARLTRAVGPLPVADACDAARQAAAALQHLADHGLVHRDVKPSNLMADRRGAVKLLDLGLAAVGDAADGPALTGTGHAVGTCDYLAPEQADPAAGVDARADVYGLGCTLFHLLTGRPPYAGPGAATVRGKVLAHAAAPVPDVRTARPDAPAGLAAVVRRMIAKDPADRFQTPAEVAAALAPFAAGSDLARLVARFDGSSAAIELDTRSAPAVPGGAGRPNPTGRRRNRVAVAVAAVLAAAAVGGTLTAAVRAWVRTTPDPAVTAPTPDQTPPPNAPDATTPRGAEPDAGAETAPPVYPVAILAFEERGAKDTGAKVTDLLFAKLAARPDLTLVDRADLKKVLDELTLSASGAARADGAARVGQLTGARLLVTGSVVPVGRKLHLVAKVIGTETGRVTGASVEGAADDLGPLVEKLADEVAGVIEKQAEKLVPRRAAVADRVAALNEKLKKAPRPAVLIRVAERPVGTPAAGSAAQTELARYCRGCGFTVVDADEGTPGQSDVLISGEGFSEAAGRVGGLVSVKARVEVKAVDRRTGKVLAVDRQTAVVVDLSEQVAGKQALQDAAAALAERVLPKLVAADKK